MLSQANAYLLAYVHVRGEEVAGEGSRQPVSAHINPGLHRQDAERLDGHSQHYPGSEAGSNHPSDASSTMSAYEHDFADNHPEEYAAMTAEERADVKSKGRKIKKKAQQKASKDKKKQCGLAEAAAKGAAKHPARGNSDAAQLVQHRYRDVHCPCTQKVQILQFQGWQALSMLKPAPHTDSATSHQHHLQSQPAAAHNSEHLRPSFQVNSLA